ncbi:MAG: PIN domain-containing protein [Candidatus Bathyarchaeia archaeon]|jgi:predicted nucleic acid-binding protein
MPRTVYDTRFFIEHYYSKDERTLQRTREEMRGREKYVSAIVIHEIYQLTLAREGREPAALRTTLLEKDFKIVKVDAEIAKSSAELRHKYKLSMADSMIAATASYLKATCISDDPHFQALKEIKTRWI